MSQLWRDDVLRGLSVPERSFGTAGEQACDHCHACQQVCPFLGKYGIDVGDESQFQELAYHCFLCGKCAEVCPCGIDGRVLALRARAEKVRAADGRLEAKGFGPMLVEKRHYPFRNYRHAHARSALFVGCSLPSFFPRTTKELAKTLENAGVGIVYDCCGKPLDELGLAGDAQRAVDGIARRLERHGVAEVAMACPNCYAYLKDRLPLRVVSVYDKLADAGIGHTDLDCAGMVFPPCPDRTERAWLADVQAFFREKLEVAGQPNCCGYGGCAQACEPELARRMAAEAAVPGEVMVYCASCAGSIARGAESTGGARVVHALSAILGIDERPDTRRSVLNRALAKFV